MKKCRILGLLLGLMGAAHAAPTDRPLNFILILVDDMGWTDLGCQGSRFYETPHIDRLAAEGVRFTEAYSACTVCSPTRAAVLTGRYPARLHVTDWIAGHVRPKAKLKVPDWTLYLPHAEVTLAEALKPGGYASASIGKWHLGNEEHWPKTQGFDENVGGYHRGQPPSYFSPYRIPTLTDGPVDEYLTDREAEEACQFMGRNAERPFFLYLPHYCVHTPLQAKKELVRKYQEKAGPSTGQSNATYAAMIDSLDQSVGRILKFLDDHELAERTVIVFTSDNGGLIGNPQRPVTSNRPLRAGKGSAYEGGVRVPLLVKWPGVTRPGAVCREPVISVDLFPTIMEMAGMREDRPVDGRSLVPLLKGEPTLNREAIYWHYPHYHPGGATPYGAVRAGSFRLVEFYEDSRLELYDLNKDIGEQTDLAASMPEKTSQLAGLLKQWRQEVGAQMPTANPDYEP